MSLHRADNPTTNEFRTVWNGAIYAYNCPSFSFHLTIKRIQYTARTVYRVEPYGRYTTLEIILMTFLVNSKCSIVSVCLVLVGFLRWARLRSLLQTDSRDWPYQRNLHSPVLHRTFDSIYLTMWVLLCGSWYILMLNTNILLDSPQTTWMSSNTSPLCLLPSPISCLW